MKIAFTHNLKTGDGEDQAEFDTAETVEAIAGALRAAGHEVVPVDVGMPVGELVARLLRIAPDLVFNTAEGHRGRAREAFYPALFEQLGLAYTGADAHGCLVSLDKHLSKAVVHSAGVPTPPAVLVVNAAAPGLDQLAPPVIVKPAFEGSSKGIDDDAVHSDLAALRARLPALLKRFPEGLLVEEYIEGVDVVVPWLEGVGVLEPASYAFDVEATADRVWTLYDYRLKNEQADAVTVKVPADLEPEVVAALKKHAAAAVSALGLLDLGRLDFRVDGAGRTWFIEANALPSLEAGASIYLSAALAGLQTTTAVLETVVQSAARRQGVGRKALKGVTVGLIHNVKRTKPTVGQDEDAEYDTPETIDAIAKAIEAEGHRVVKLEATPDLLAALPSAGIDVAFNIAEGQKGRGRESWVPAVLDLLGVPYTGSDATTMAITLDKALAKRVVRSAGVATPHFLVIDSVDTPLPADLKYPVIVKPVAEGSSKGVTQKSVARNAAELRAVVNEVVGRYGQGAMVEGFLTGREFTVGLLGERRVLPPMEIAFTEQASELPVYSFEHKQAFSDEVKYVCPAQTTPALDRALRKAAREAFVALGCRDVARIDLRLDADGVVNFIECNPLPGLTPDWSDLCLIAKAAGMDYPALVAAILRPALRRLRAQRQASKVRGASPGARKRPASVAGGETP